MLQFVQATNEDILSVIPQLTQSDETALALQHEAFEKGRIPLDGVAIAIREGDRCIGAYGLVELWPGVGRVWGLFSEELIRDHPTMLCLHAKRDLKRADKVLFQRIEATSGVDREDELDFLLWLGFTVECIMRRYCPNGEDAYLYAKVNQ